MSLTRTRPARTAFAAAVVLLTGALGGCSISSDDEPERAEQSVEDEPTPTEETPTATPTPSETPTSAPSESPTATASPTPRGLRGALLGAQEMPQLNDSTPWTQRGTRAIGPAPFGLCQKFDLLTIGASDGVQRRFTAQGGVAGQQVAEFPDAQNAVRASRVIEAWHRDCAQRVRGRDINVRPFEAVTVPGGKGSWYLVSFQRGGEGHFHSFGMVLTGQRMTLLSMDHPGQDHNYEPGQDPMELAVAAAGAKLAGVG